MSGLSDLRFECTQCGKCCTNQVEYAHVYVNHIEGLKQQLTRETKALPSLKLENKPVDEMRFEDIEIVDYEHHPFIKFKVAV